jgi:hypothetical protein
MNFNDARRAAPAEQRSESTELGVKRATVPQL